jgi:hypothetical protein
VFKTLLTNDDLVTCEEVNDDADAEYVPPKRRQEPHKAPDRVYDSDGEEETELTEKAAEAAKKVCILSKA